MTHDKLKQLFDQNADTWLHETDLMTSERFIEVVSALIAAQPKVSEVQRPQFKDYFPEGTTVQDIHTEFSENPELYNYIQALDSSIDYIELQAAQPPTDFLNLGSTNLIKPSEKTAEGNCQHDWHTFFNKGYRKCNKCGEEYTIKAF